MGRKRRRARLWFLGVFYTYAVFHLVDWQFILTVYYPTYIAVYAPEMGDLGIPSIYIIFFLYLRCETSSRYRTRLRSTLHCRASLRSSKESPSAGAHVALSLPQGRGRNFVQGGGSTFSLIESLTSRDRLC